VTNKIITIYLRCLASDRPQEWLHWLPRVEYCYNISFQLSIRTSLFHAIYGRDPPTVRSYSPGEAHLPVVDAAPGPRQVPGGGAGAARAGTSVAQDVLRLQAPAARLCGRRVGMAMPPAPFDCIARYQGARQTRAQVLRAIPGHGEDRRRGLHASTADRSSFT
jgi:hypothetical protein